MTKGLMPKRKEILKAVEHSNASRSGPAFLWLDEQLVVLEHSKDIQALLSLSGTLKGRMVTELFAELIGLEDNMRRIALQKTGRFSLEYINRAPANEKPDYLSIRAMPLSLGFKGLILFIEDANENGRLMQELAQRRNELILKQEQLHKANIELAQANRLKGLMISVASHEIGNRLTHIIGLGADLLEQIPASKPYRDPLERMYLAANHLVMSMNQLINLDQIEQGLLPAKRKSINANVVLKDSVDLFLLPERNRFVLQIEIPEETRFVQCDEVHLQQVIFNLLSNAIKYTPQGGTISVAATSQEFSWSFVVENSGEGIPPEEQKDIFQPYSRTKERTADWIPGAGLGLFISQSIVKAYGGRIDLTSSPGQKTVFRVSLPSAFL